MTRRLLLYRNFRLYSSKEATVIGQRKRTRVRRADVKYRPIKQSHAEPGIDHRTYTRYSTIEEKELAAQALVDLEQQQNRIILVPAPEPHFEGHKIRVVERRNPQWYIDFGLSYWKSDREFTLKRSRVVQALQRVVKGRVRGNGHERELLEWLKNNLKSNPNV